MICMPMGSRVSKIQRRGWKTSYKSDWKATFKEDVTALGGFICQKCGCKATKSNPVQRHHIIPKAKGGRDVRINYKILCKKCHSKQHKHQSF